MIKRNVREKIHGSKCHYNNTQKCSYQTENLKLVKITREQNIFQAAKCMGQLCFNSPLLFL